MQANRQLLVHISTRTTLPKSSLSYCKNNLIKPPLTIPMRRMLFTVLAEITDIKMRIHSYDVILTLKERVSFTIYFTITIISTPVRMITHMTEMAQDYKFAYLTYIHYQL